MTLDPTVVPAIESLLASAIAYGATKLLLALAAKFKLQIDVTEQAKIRQFAKEAAIFAEEWAAKKFKLEQKAVGGEAKLETAIAHLVSRTGIDESAADKMIHSVLPELGIGALNALGKLAAAAEMKLG